MFRNQSNNDEDDQVNQNSGQLQYQLLLPRLSEYQGPMMQRVQRSSKHNMWDMASDGYLYDFVK